MFNLLLAAFAVWLTKVIVEKTLSFRSATREIRFMAFIGSFLALTSTSQWRAIRRPPLDTSLSQPGSGIRALVSHFKPDRLVLLGIHAFDPNII
jgi:hypothetical protein